MPKMKEQNNLELEITGLTATGAGVGRAPEGFTVFVPGALPEEAVTARITQRNKRFARAKLLQILRQAPARLASACPHNAVCGGCPLQHLAYEQQLVWKRRWVEDALRRIGGMEAQVLPTVPAEETFFYRSRVQLHVLRQGGRLQLGFYERGSQEGAACCSCLLMRPVLVDITQLLNVELADLSVEINGLGHAALRCDITGQKAALVLIGLPPDDSLRKLAARLMAAEPRLLSVWANWGRAVYGIYGADWGKLAGADKLPESLGELKLEISPAAFTQVNSAQALRLYQLVAEYAELSAGETLLDIYSGVGMIALYLAQKTRQVIGVEDYAPAVADARRNAELNGITNCRFEAGAAEEVLPHLLEEGITAGIVVLDPPRAGCAPQVVNAVAAMQPRRVVYVSCDPATLARDLRLFADLGYATRRVQPLDMFPHSGHVETVALLTQEIL